VSSTDQGLASPTLRRRNALVALGILLLTMLPAHGKNLRDLPAAQRFIDEMVVSHQFDADWLSRLIGEARYQERIIEAISHPAEAKPWHQYRKIFITPSRIRGGAEFWDKHTADLVRAEEKFSVPAEIIVAILGVETAYGHNTGSYRVLDALATLAFDYPKRSQFFRSELEQFLLLSREEQVDPLALYGSYAGAMGWPQFVSSSYRSYAIDFDGDGKRDLWENPADAIGSVANYLKLHGWQPGQPIAARARLSGTGPRRSPNGGLKPEHSLAALRAAGLEAEQPLPEELPATVVELDSGSGSEYWLGLPNFYVITRYNHSALYAMAVYQLSQEIRALRQAFADSRSKES
jgi:membrane-bound lytic murein transglycosylase B